MNSNKDSIVFEKWTLPTSHDLKVGDGGIAALVVTYNADVTGLSKNLSSIRDQVDVVLAFDNGSSNVSDLVPLFDDLHCAYFLSKKNLGVSRALNAGCKFASDKGFKFVLLLDQDCVAQDHMAEVLRNDFTLPDIALVAPNVVDTNVRETLPSHKTVNEALRVITAGSLLLLDAWRAVGGYDERLFVDWVDFDFCANLRQHGYKIMQDNSVCLFHELGRLETAATIAGVDVHRTNHPFWRQKDKARSWAIMRNKYGYSPVGIQERLFIDEMMLHDLLVEHNRPELLKAFHEGKQEGIASLQG